MRILHTSDWHLGSTICEHRRYDEFEEFLNFLTERIERENFDALLVSGDVFDSGTPSARAQELYYSFLGRIASSGKLRSVIVTAGNHDSPSFLAAPGSLLRNLGIHVVASIPEDPESEVFVLPDQAGNPGAIVCAVPYPRERDVFRIPEGEDFDPSKKNERMLAGIRDHYEEVCAYAKKKRLLAGIRDLPLIACGHLFAAGGKTISGDGVRELYVGNLLRAGADVFPKDFNYVALGHLHLPQKVAGENHIRYSGSPLAMGFSDAAEKRVLLSVEFSPGKKEPVIEEIRVPPFRRYEHCEGNMDELFARIGKLEKEPEKIIYLETDYTGNESVPGFREALQKRTENTNLEILSFRNRTIGKKALERAAQSEELKNLTPEQVFLRKMDSANVPAEKKEILLNDFRELEQHVRESAGEEKS